MTRKEFIAKWKKMTHEERLALVVIKGFPLMSWNVAYFEIMNNTDFGKKVLKKVRNV